MAFIGLLFTIILALAIILLTVLVLGVAPIVIGTVICCKTVHKVVGLVFKIIGFVILIPAIVIGFVLAALLFI